MSVNILRDPIEDPRWSDLLDRHPSASIFHSPGWLSALRRTYGYEPFVVTSSSAPSLENGVVVCRVKSWTSRRLVSLPFSDHCDPLLGDSNDLSEMLGALAGKARAGGWNSVELRPRAADEHSFAMAARFCGMKPSREYSLHSLDLGAESAEIFRRFHPSSTQRAIRRAEREGLTYERGTSERMLQLFYGLLRMARRRHGLPPQPIAWFRNLLASLRDRAAIHVASKNGQAVASILTLSFKKTMVYKYGGSDAAFHRLGAMPFLFWQVIRDAQARGFTTLDLGRSDNDQPGLIAFKDHLGASRSRLAYYAYPENPRRQTAWISRAARTTLTYLPDPALDLAGRLLYKHLG